MIEARQRPLDLNDQAPHEYFPEGGGRFFDKDVDVELTFLPGPDGEAGKVVLHQEGHDFEAVRQAGGRGAGAA